MKPPDTGPKARRVLVVEDDRVTQHILSHYFQACGCLADTAPTVEQALACLAGCAYDLVTVDGHLPDGSGCDVARAVYRSPRHRRTATVAVSSDNSPERIRAFLDAGAELFLAKPVSLDQIRSLLKVLADPRCRVSGWPA